MVPGYYRGERAEGVGNRIDAASAAIDGVVKRARMPLPDCAAAAMTRFCRGAAGVFLVLVAGCHPPPPGLTPLEQPSNLQAAPPRVSGAIALDRTRQRVFESPGAAATPPKPEGEAAGQEERPADRPSLGSF